MNLGKYIENDRNIQNGIQAACNAAKKHHVPIAWIYVDYHAGSVHLRHEKSPSQTPQLDNGPPLPSDTALVLHTSGTTSRPKSVPLTHRNLLASISNIIQTYSLTALDVSYLVMPLFHVHGLLAGLLAPLKAHASVVIPFQRQFSASRFWDDMSTWQCTYYTAVPTIHAVILGLGLPKTGVPKSLRFVRSCSSSLPLTVFEKLERKLAVPICEAYAMTEVIESLIYSI